MSENNTPSYYEIALTNRQVLIAFVVILGSILVSFLSGVWVGRKDAPVPGEAQIAALGEDGDPASEYEQLGFFDPDESDPPADDSKKPDLKPLLGPPPSTDTTLAQDVGSSPPAASPPPSKPENRPAPPPTPVPPPPAPVPPPPPRQASPPPSPPAAVAQEGFVIQVFSTRDESQARKVLKQLTDGGFRAFMSPVKVEQQDMYRVRIGPFGERADADKQAKQVKSRFRLDTWVTAASN